VRRTSVLLLISKELDEVWGLWELSETPEHLLKCLISPGTCNSALKHADVDFAETSWKQSLSALYHTGTILRDINLLQM